MFGKLIDIIAGKIIHMVFQEIRTRINRAKNVDFGDVINNSIDLFKIIWVQGLLMCLMFVATVFVLEILFFIPLSFFGFFSAFFTSESLPGFLVELYIVTFLVLLILFLVFVFLVSTLSVALIGGLFIIFKKADHGEHYSVNDFFTLLRRDKIVKTFKVALVQFGISLIFVLMYYFPFVYAMIPVSYFVIIYAYNHELTTSEIVKLSFDIGNKFWVQTFLLRLVAGFVALLGVLFCGIGVLATFAFILIPQYFIYKQTIGFEDKDEVDSIGFADN